MVKKEEGGSNNKSLLVSDLATLYIYHVLHYFVAMAAVQRTASLCQFINQARVVIFPHGSGTRSPGPLELTPL
jgi:hypothetical protein